MGILSRSALALLAGTNGWLFFGYLGPLRDRPEPAFVLATMPLWHLPVWWIGALAVATAVARLLVRRLETPGFRPRHLRPACVASIVLLSMPLAAVCALASPLRPHASPWVYVFVDLHAWVLGGAAVLLAADLDAALGRPVGQRVDRLLGRAATSPASATWLDTALVVILMASSLATSPLFRFQSAVIGDEPKYVRYLENWYRGRGMDMTDLAPIAELPPGDRPAVLRNLVHIRRAAALVVSDVGHDLRRLAGLSAEPRPGPAVGAGGWFVRGRHGGVYQVHNPGFSFLLLPGYVIDRAFLNWTSAFHPQLPSDLYCTAVLVLGLYVAWGLAVFRLLVAYTNRVVISWAIAGLVLLSLPSTAFAYQYYPEVVGGLAIALLARFVLLSTSTRWLPVAVHGLLAGFLCWLHVRFGLVAVLSVVLFAVSRRRTGRAVLTFAAAFMAPVAALAAFYYYVSGSILPWALHALCTDEAAPFSLSRAIRDVPNYWLDAGGGLVAHAPFCLLAVPGVWLVWRRSRLVSVAVTLFVLALAVPAAGHGWVGGGTTPLRLVAAVVPLLALPLAEAIIRHGRSRWFLATLAVLSVVALQNGLTYNTHLIKSEPWLLGPTASGWLFPLLFPDCTADSRIAQPSFWIWVVTTFSLLVWPIAGRRAPGTARTVAARPASWTAAVTAVAVALAASGSVLGGWTGSRLRTRFMADEDEVRYRLLTFHAAHPGGHFWLSSRGRVDLASLFPNPSGAPIVTGVTPEAPRAGQPLVASIATDPRLRRRVWGTATVAFGDDTAAVRRRFVGEVTARHEFAAPGTYDVRFDISLPGAPAVHRVQSVTVHRVSSASPLTPLASAALQPALMKRPVTVAIEEVRFGEARVEIRCYLAPRSPRDRFWVWLVAMDGRHRAGYQEAQARSTGGDPSAVWLTLSPSQGTEDTALVGLVVGVSRPGRPGVEGRSELAVLPWPGPRLTLGADVVERVPAARR